MTDFTPLTGFLGGSIVGLSALVLLLFKGKVAGISGILNGLFDRDLNELPWRFVFLVGIVLGPLLANFLDFHLPSKIELSWSVILIGGALVGFGTNMAGGCTSGHGICGVGRFSSRSIWATLVFMGIAMLTVFVSRHLLGSAL